MSLSEKRKQALEESIKEGSEINRYLKTLKIAGAPTWYLGKLSLLTYISAENLIKHSKTLSIWTKVLVGTSVVLIALVIVQIIVLS